MAITINLGKILITDKGEWSSTYVGGYDILDVVTSGNGSYMSKVKANTAVLTDRNSWIPLVDTAAIEQNKNDILQLSTEVTDINLQNAVQSDKIRDIENVLSTANLGQSAQLSVSGRKTVSLPKNASNGGMQVKLEGLTAENLVVNGDFRNGLTGWIFSPEITNKVLVGDVLSFTAPAASKYAGVNVSVVTGRKYYIRATFKSTSNQVVFNLAGVTNIAHSGGGGFETKSTIQSWASPTGNYALRVQDLRTSGWDEIQIKGGNSGFICVDLTAIFGAGNEPDLATCDAMFSSYFEGKKNFAATGRVRSVGKNLFDKTRTNITQGKYLAVSNTLVDSTDYKVINKVKLDGNTIYSMNASYQSNFASICFFDKNQQFISAITLSSIYIGANNSKFTTPLNCEYASISVRATVNVDAFQIERGSTLSITETYKETSLYLTAPELRSSGLVKDEIRKGANGYELVKRVGVGMLGEELITNAADREFTSDTGFWTKSGPSVIANGITTFDGSSGASIYNNSTNLMAKDGIYILTLRILKNTGASYISFWSSSINIGTTYATGIVSILFKSPGNGLQIASSNNVEIDYVSIRKVSLIDGAHAGNSYIEYGSGIHYTLATPVISPISHGGILNSAENGTVYHEPVIADAGVYGTNMPILLTDYPISALEEIIKHENGVDTYLDVSTAVIAADKLSFTHPSLVSGDLVLFTYSFAKENTNGNITATFYDSNVVKIDTVTGKAYRINEVVTNGVLTRTLIEV